MSLNQLNGEQVFKRNWRLSVTAVLLTATITAVFVVFGTSSDAGRTSDLWPVEGPVLPVKVEEVFFQSSYLSEQLYSGRLSALRTSDLAFENAGKILQVIAEEGDLVQVGEVLARLDSSLLRASRKQLNAEIRASQERLRELINGPRTETIDQTEAQITELSHQLALARINLDRNRVLLEKGVISRSLLDSSETEVETLEARLSVVKSRLSELRNGFRSEQIEAQRARLDGLRARLENLDLQIAKTDLRAPYSGRVSKRFFDEGTVVEPAQAVLRILEVGSLEAQIGVPVQHSKTLRPGETKSLLIDDREYMAIIRSIGPDIDSATRTVPVFLILENSKMELLPRPGQVVQMIQRVEVEESGFWLPIKSLTRGTRGLWSCYAVRYSPENRADQVVRRAVEILHTEGERVYVRGTLADGDRVIVDGIHRITPGQKIQPISS